MLYLCLEGYTKSQPSSLIPRLLPSFFLSHTEQYATKAGEEPGNSMQAGEEPGNKATIQPQ